MSVLLPPAIIFDLDDTIISDTASIDDSWIHGIRLCAPHFDDNAVQRVMQAIIDERTVVWGGSDNHRRGRLNLLETRRKIAITAVTKAGIDDPALGAAIGDAYSARRDELLVLFPGAIDTLRTIRARGTKLAMITNGSQDMQRAKINRFQLESLFDYILVEGEFGAGKPEEVVYRHALQQVDVAPREAMMVGDNLEWDVAGPQRIGITGVWIDPHSRGLPATTNVVPDRIINNISELLS